MAAESILTYRKHGFPKTQNSEKSYQTIIEYVGPLATLASAEPAANSVWGDYDGYVTGSSLTPIEGTDKAELSITCEYSYDGSSGGAGTLKEISYEVEWEVFQRSMYEHPEFAIGQGGTYELASYDISDIENWKNEPDPALKSVYKYLVTSSSYESELTASAQMFARGIELGQETFEDYYPVIRKTSSYVSGLPGTSSAGAKETPPTFAGQPSGYEWRKSADRAIKAGGQTRWERVEEWVGAIKVLTDKSAIYWSAPA